MDQAFFGTSENAVKPRVWIENTSLFKALQAEIDASDQDPDRNQLRLFDLGRNSQILRNAVSTAVAVAHFSSVTGPASML